jgi:hypothetical protein
MPSKSKVMAVKIGSMIELVTTEKENLSGIGGFCVHFADVSQLVLADGIIPHSCMYTVHSNVALYNCGFYRDNMPPYFNL